MSADSRVQPTRHLDESPDTCNSMTLCTRNLARESKDRLWPTLALHVRPLYRNPVGRRSSFFPACPPLPRRERVGVGPQPDARGFRLRFQCYQGWIVRVAPEQPSETSPDLFGVHIEAINRNLRDGSAVSVKRLPSQLDLLLAHQFAQGLL